VIDGNRFKVITENFELPNLTKNCKFVMISDLHNKVYGNRNDKVLSEVNRINPDFILVAGELVTSELHEDITPSVDLVNELAKSYKVYYGLGNHESKLKVEKECFGDKFDKLKKSISNKNVIFLENETVNIPEYNINITGLDLDLDYFAHFRIIKMKDGYLENTLPKRDKSKCNILIAHNPDYFEEYAKWGADLVLSGHVHGGIMRLPLLGGVIAPSYKLFPKYDGGVFKSGNSTMLLGRGMGAHTFKLRFFNPAELCEVNIKPKA
jgi:predicted MPP superfamily phosphohydrolase